MTAGLPIVDRALPHLVGYNRSPQHLSESLLAGRSVIVFGASGFGKTILLEAIVATLVSSGAEPIRIRASVQSHPAPFSSITDGSNLRLSQAVGGEDAVTTAGLLAYIVESSRCARPVVVVDDAHLLDAETMNSLYQLTAGQAITLLLSSDISPGIEPSPSAEATSRLLSELWIAGVAERVDLEPLSVAESADLMREFAPSTHFDRVTQALLHSRSGGSRVLLRELTAEAVRANPLPGAGARHTTAPAAHSQRISDLLAHQLRTLTPTQLATLSLVGSVVTISHDRALLISDSLELEDLVRRGYLVPVRGRSGHLRAHTLLGEAAPSVANSAVLRTQTRQLVTTLLTDRTHGFATTPAECQLIAETWTVGTELTADVLPEWGSELVADILLHAARRSRSLGLAESALAFAGLSSRIAPSLPASIEYSRALASVARYAQALAVATAAEAMLGTPDDGVKLMRWRIALGRLAPLSDAAIAEFVAAAAGWFPESAMMRGMIAFVRLTESMQNLDWASVATDGEAIARSPQNNLITRIRAACLSSLGHAIEGRTVHGLGLLELAATLNGQDSIRPESDLSSSEGLALEIFSSSATVRCMSGLDVHLAGQQLDDWISRVVDNNDLANLGLLSCVSAELAQFRGDAESAEAELRVADSTLSRSDPEGLRPWVNILHTSALARLGFGDAARNRAFQTKALRSVIGSKLLQFAADRSQVELLVGSGDLVGARAVAHRLLAEVDGRVPMLRAWLLNTMVELGEPAAASMQGLNDLAADSDSPIIRVLADRARAAADDDAALMDQAATHLAELGSFGRAAQVSTDAATLHEHAVDQAAAARSRERARACTAASANPRDVVLTAPLPVADALTAREREITDLAGRGLSNREIASELFLSVRTVESHLYQARIKTGLSPRRAGHESTPADLGDEIAGSVPASR